MDQNATPVKVKIQVEDPLSPARYARFILPRGIW
jgi:hypothetical protein